MTNKTISDLPVRTIADSDEIEVQATGSGASGKTTVKAITQRVALQASDFGVIADGTTDDTSNLQSAITTAATTGRVLYLPAGTMIVESLTIPSGSRIVGQGVNKTIIKRKASSSTTNFILYNTALYTTMEFLSVDGNKANQTVAAHNISLSGCRDNFFNNIFSYNAKGSGGTYGCGIAIQDGANDTSGTITRITNCNIYSNDTDGIYINKDWLVQVSGCRILANGGSGVCVINNVYPPAQYVQNYITITKNYCAANSIAGIRFVGFYTGGTALKPVYGYSAPQQIGCIISDNTCYLNSQYGIAFQGGWSTISGNVCTRNGTTTAHAGMLCNAWNTTVSGNTVYDSSYFGIDGGGSSACVFTGNTISYNGVTSGLGSVGLNVGACTNCVISSNIFEGNAGTQIVMYGLDGDGTTLFEFVGSGNKISDNLMYISATQNGMLVGRSYSGNLLLTNNLINSNSGSSGFTLETNLTNIVRQSGNVDNVAGTIPSLTAASTLIVPDVGEQFTITGTTGITNIFTTSQNNNSGKIVNITMTSGGSGYTVAPNVSFSGGGGSNAAGTAYLGNSGVVAGVIMTNRGSGYTSAPTVAFSTGAASATANLGISNSEGRVITLLFTETLTVTDGGNLRLAGNLNAVANTTLTLRSFNNTWVEVSRSVN